MIEWWYWVLLGIVLVLLELAIPAFFVLWFGLAALLVGGLMLVFEMALVAQLIVWGSASLAALALWLRLFRPRLGDNRIGSATGEVIGECGLLVDRVAPFQRGRVRFQKPVLGAEEWPCLAELEIAAGERVRVVAIEGHYLKVQPQ